jgi:dihydroflavonol-4-reductase
VRDVAQGLIAASARGRRGESYILSGEKISIPHLLDIIRAITGGHFFQMKIPFELAQFAARLAPLYYRLTRITPRFTPYSLEVLRSNSNISHAKVTIELGYRPRPLVESITDSIRWFLESKGPKFSEIAIR